MKRNGLTPELLHRSHVAQIFMDCEFPMYRLLLNTLPCFDFYASYFCAGLRGREEQTISCASTRIQTNDLRTTL